MGVRIVGADQAEGMIRRVEHTGRRRVLRELFVKGQQLKNLAVRMAPRDEGNLENAIKMRPEGAGPVRDTGGRFMRQEVEVYIDFDADAGAGHTVGEYAWEIHEHMFPMGYKKRGPETLAKQASNPDITVGGGFLDRAAEEIEQALDQSLKDILDDIT